MAYWQIVRTTKSSVWFNTHGGLLFSYNMCHSNVGPKIEMILQKLSGNGKLVPYTFGIKFTDFCPKNRWLCAWCQQSCGFHRLASLHWSLAKFCNSKMSEAHCKVWHFSRALSSVVKHFICSSHCHWSSSYSLDRIPIVSCEDWFKRGQQRLAQLQGVVFGALKCFIWHQFWEIFNSNS